MPAADVWYKNNNVTYFSDDANTFVWDETNGGRSLTYEGEKIYYPAPGYRMYGAYYEQGYGEGRLWHVGLYGDYWTGSPTISIDYVTKDYYFTNVYYMRITKSYSVTMSNLGYKGSGQAVRCMKSK